MQEIVLYSQPGCPQCRAIHMLLDRKGVEYVECQDIEEMRAKGISHTPALRIGDRILQGKEIFDYANGVK